MESEMATFPQPSLLSGKAPGSKLDSSAAVYGACCALNDTLWPNALPFSPGSLKRGCQLRRRPRHLTMVQNYDARPKVALVLLQNANKTKTKHTETVVLCRFLD
ncbi:hypothetical protein AVEN_204657-1 [Araneus ventricosus]|uniref:Uncharacterized protein n=1 Tax=Araneus ventricosus TaxID=182803 RepID=A0A4Y2E5G2_ARAVE|nr:hypothetical protein AVEN_147199-1 [Araneus ventricosus]GBM23529.1 hypothetical protein AVEN_204657-1 [Araneus ventricosus]